MNPIWYDTNRYNDTEAAAGAWDLVQVSLSQKSSMCKAGLRWIGIWMYKSWSCSRSSTVAGWGTPQTGQWRAPLSSTLENFLSLVVLMLLPIVQSEVTRWIFLPKMLLFEVLFVFAVQVYSDGCELAVNEFLETNIDIIGGELEYKFSTSLIKLKLMFTVQMKLFSAVAHCFPRSSHQPY